MFGLVNNPFGTLYLKEGVIPLCNRSRECNLFATVQTLKNWVTINEIKYMLPFVGYVGKLIIDPSPKKAAENSNKSKLKRIPALERAP